MFGRHGFLGGTLLATWIFNNPIATDLIVMPRRLVGQVDCAPKNKFDSVAGILRLA